MAPLQDWNDARLNELARRVTESATKEELRSFRRETDRQHTDLKEEVKERADGLKTELAAVAEKVEDLAGDPAAEKRARNQAAFVACIAAAAGGFVTLMIFLLSNGVVLR